MSMSPNPHQNMPENVISLIESLDLHIASKYPVPEIGPLLERSVLAGGKRLRPTLCYLMGGIFEIDLEKITPYGRVAEFVHAASLAHDDVLDMADRRRDKPTINALSSNYQAVLSGDFLISQVIRELSDLKAHALLGDLSSVMEYLVYGEWLQEASRANTEVTSDRLRQIADFKTASLIGWCCTVPARMREMDEKLVTLCRDLGVALGVGFQMVDDVIDYDAHGGKDYARDLKNGFVNFVTWELIQKNPHLVPELKLFLSGEKLPTVEWQIQAIEEAKKRVRQRSMSELQSAKDKLEMVIDRVLGPNGKDNSFATSMLELIDIMGLRQV